MPYWCTDVCHWGLRKGCLKGLSRFCDRGLDTSNMVFLYLILPTAQTSMDSMVDR